MKKTWLLTAVMTTALAGCRPVQDARIQEPPPAPSPSQLPEPTPTEWPACPEPAPGVLLLVNKPMGYCLLYPDGLLQIGSPVEGLCLVPAGSTMGCHNARAFFSVEPAAGRSASQAADELIGREGIETERSTVTIDGEQAVLLASVPAQDSLRAAFLVHDGRLYDLRFVLPNPGDPAGVVEQFERLYATVIGSFTFIPPGPVPAPEEQPMVNGSAAIVFVRDGIIHVWEETTGEIHAIDTVGDAILVEMSPDGELVAFVRRAYFSAGGFDANEQSALWVIGRDGSNPRELVSAGVLRSQLDAAETDSSNFPRLAWIPNSHRLLYSGDLYNAHGYGEGAHTPWKGVFQVDADSGAFVELAPMAGDPEFSASPDGQWVALVTPSSLSFISLEDRRLRQDILTYPATGVPGKVTPKGVWTQDSTAYLIAAPIPEEDRSVWSFTLWRVPVDGSQAVALLTVANSSPNIVFSPDGSVVAVIRESLPGPDQCARGQRTAHLARPLRLAGCPPVAGTFLVPLPEDLGPLSVPSDTLDFSRLVWSPSGMVYVSDLSTRGDFHPLCPDARQPIEVCGPSIHFSQQVEWLEWVDRTRFLYVTALPRQLYLGSLAGPATLIADDPSSFDAVAATCLDKSEFIADVTVQDGTRFAPGSVFTKTWRLRNSGTCTWDDSYRLGFLSGNRMSGPRTTTLGSLDISPAYRDLFPTVHPGETIEVTVMLVAPEVSGVHRGVWQLFSPAGRPFGTRPYVEIEVP